MGEELVEGRYVLTAADATQALHRLTGWALEHEVELGSLAVERPSLEDIYLELAGEGAE